MRSHHSAETPPRISVIMSAYNAERWLAEAIESVLNQTFEDFEFLIHDDGSTDASLAILREYAARDGRIVVSTDRNQGISAARNLLHRKARGEFLAVMDADDICRLDRFERQIAYLDAHPEIAVLGGFVRVIDLDGRPVLDAHFPTNHDDIDASNFEGHTAINHPTVIMRRKAVLAVGEYDEGNAVAHDLDLWLRMAEHVQIANYPAVVLDYRVHDASITANREAEVAGNLRARELAAERRGLPPPAPLKPVRPAADRNSQSEHALKFAWQAWKCGYQETARHYFMKSLKLNPLSYSVWKGFVFGLLRRKKEIR